MKRMKFFTVAALVLAVGGAFATKSPTAANVWAKPGGTCSLRCSSVVSANVCSVPAPYFSTLAKVMPTRLTSPLRISHKRKAVRV